MTDNVTEAPALVGSFHLQQFPGAPATPPISSSPSLLLAEGVIEVPSKVRKKRGAPRRAKAEERPPVQEPKQPRSPQRKVRRAAPAKRPRTNYVRRAKRPKGVDAASVVKYVEIFGGLEPADGAILSELITTLSDTTPAQRDRILAVLPKVFA